MVCSIASANASGLMATANAASGLVLTKGLPQPPRQASQPYTLITLFTPWTNRSGRPSLPAVCLPFWSISPIATGMSSFATLAETRRLGAPIVRLFRVALGRDPDPIALQHYALRLGGGAALQDLARDIVESEEFRRRHGCDASPGAAFAARMAAAVAPEGAARAAAQAALLAAAEMGMDQAGLIATLSDSPQGRDSIPLLPGLAPGAPPDDPAAYWLWAQEYDNPTASDLARIPPLDGPRVAIMMAAGDSTVEGALRTLESLRCQVYGNWELLLTTRLLSSWPHDALAAAARGEPRLRLLKAPDEPVNPAERQQGLLVEASDELACFLDPGDTLPPTALHEVVTVFATHPETQLLFTDEDVADLDGRRDPRFKPDFSPDLLLAGNCIGQLAVYRTGLLNRIGGLRRETSPYAHYDLALRAAAALAEPGAIFHLPAMLCHRAEPATDWPAPADTLPRVAPALVAMEPTPWPRPRFRLPDPLPLVSVIILTRDRPDLLAACVAGVLGRTDYPTLELLIVDNDSRDAEALALLSRLETTPRVRVLRHPEPFNFAALNNAAAREAAGEVLLLLNNDTEVLHPDWLRELVSHVVRPGIGAVGARLLYPDGSVQHAGMLLGPAGTAVHVGRSAARDAPGYDGQLACARDLSAVTGACMALRRDTFFAVGGMEERLAVTWNDVDLCLRVRAAGLRVIWTPHATLLHREGVTRGLEADDPVKLARFRQEQAFMQTRWEQAMDVDPFLNPNLLASEAGPLVLTRPRVRRPWQR